MKIEGFKNCSDPNWECYEKIYGTLFRLVISRHQRDDPRDRYNAVVIDLDLPSREVVIAENIDQEWIVEFDGFVNVKVQH